MLIPVAIFGYLLWQGREDIAEAWGQPKRWDRLVLAQIVALTATVVGFLRWHILVRAFDIPFKVREALHLGFLGYLLNFVSFGSVGGDLFKAILVAKDRPEKRPEAVASVLLDRAIGLLGLVLLAWVCLASGQTSLSPLMARDSQRRRCNYPRIHFRSIDCSFCWELVRHTCRLDRAKALGRRNPCPHVAGRASPEDTTLHSGVASCSWCQRSFDGRFLGLFDFERIVSRIPNSARTHDGRASRDGSRNSAAGPRWTRLPRSLVSWALPATPQFAGRFLWDSGGYRFSAGHTL